MEIEEKYNKLNKLVLNICEKLNEADKKYYRPYGEFISYVNACEKIKELILQEKENIIGEIELELYK